MFGWIKNLCLCNFTQINFIEIVSTFQLKKTKPIKNFKRNFVLYGWRKGMTHHCFGLNHNVKKILVLQLNQIGHSYIHRSVIVLTIWAQCVCHFMLSVDNATHFNIWSQPYWPFLSRPSNPHPVYFSINSLWNGHNRTHNNYKSAAWWTKNKYTVCPFFTHV